MDSEGRVPEGRLCHSPATLPLQQVVSSASQMPGSPRKSSASSHIASPRYVQQYRLLMDHQHQAFEEERNLWYIERSELYEKLSRLEALLHTYQPTSSNQGPFLPENDSMVPIAASAFTASATFKHISTGDEFWRGAGGKSDAQPNRVFSDSTNQYIKVGDKHPRIAENSGIYEHKAPLLLDPIGLAAQSRETDSMKTDKSLDGINFKQNPKISSISLNLMTPQSPSPNRSPSPAYLSPKVDKISSLLAMPYDPYTKDAGHTPVSRKTDYNLDDSATLSDQATPTNLGKESCPLALQVSVVRPPCEHGDSSFLPADKENGDVELKGPLGLTNNNLEDQGFLQELDSKLQIAKFENESFVESRNSDEQNGDDPFSDQPEPEPRLKIKKSMNFGAPLGSAYR